MKQITKQRRYLEKDFQTDFNRWLKYKLYKTGAFELKVSKTNSLPFSHVKDHQINALYAAKHGHFVFKIPDLGNQNPFDCFMLVMVPAFIVIMYQCRSIDQKEFIMIDVDTFAIEKDSSSRKSLTYERAKEIGQVYCLI